MKKRICIRFKERPSTHQELADWAKRELSLELSRSTVSTVLKDLGKWLEVPVDELTSVRARQPKYVSLEKALLTWFSDIRARGAVVSDAMLTEKAKVYGSLLGKFSLLEIFPAWSICSEINLFFPLPQVLKALTIRRGG